VLAALETVGDRLHRTPTFGCATLAERIGARRAFLKAELFQRTGSFKPRGVLNRLAALTAEERARGVVTWSAGNHAQAVAYAAAREGIDSLVLMWRTANPTKVAATRGYGATVDTTSAHAAAAHELLFDTIERTGRTYVDPFDHPLVMAGQGTVGLELLEDVPAADLVVVPVGGGGLIAGVATAVKGVNPAARVVGVEPEGAAGLTAALAAGRSVRIDAHTVADGLAPPFAGERCLAVAQHRVDEVVLVSDGEIERAMRFLYARAKLACEPAGAAATAALLAGKIPVGRDETVVAVVSGGNADPKIASGILASADES
jgi:threonine dehydratase